MIPAFHLHNSYVTHGNTFLLCVLQLRDEKKHDIGDFGMRHLAPDHAKLHVAPVVPTRLSIVPVLFVVLATRKEDGALSQALEEPGLDPRERDGRVHDAPGDVRQVRAFLWAESAHGGRRLTQGFLRETVQCLSVRIVAANSARAFPDVVSSLALCLGEGRVEAALVNVAPYRIAHDEVAGICALHVECLYRTGRAEGGSPKIITRLTYFDSSTSFTGKDDTYAMIAFIHSAPKDHPARMIPPAFFSGWAGGMLSRRTMSSRKSYTSRARSRMKSPSSSFAFSRVSSSASGVSFGIVASSSSENDVLPG